MTLAKGPAKVAVGERRYPGVASFEDTDVHRMLFYGRTDEIYDLKHLVLAERLVVLFSRSGIGKTSIINAGLMQPLRDAGHFPIVVRVNSDDDDPIDSFYRGMEAACNRGVELGQIDSFEPDDPKEWNKTSFWHFFKTLYLWQDDKPLSPVLIIDQFEELFTLISEQPRQEFIDQLADLVRGTRPKNVHAGDADFGERPPDVKVVLSIREDFMANLEEMAERIPAILNVRFRLSALDSEQARQAIVEPSQLESEDIATPAFVWADDALQCTLDFLRSRKSAEGGSELGDTVEPFQLQLICQYVEELVLAEERDTVTLDALGGEATLREILAKFYSDSADKICLDFPERGLRRRIEKLCEYGLITPKGRRLLREESTIIESNGVPREVLARMVQLRLIRKEPRIGDNYYELSHDTLIGPILHSRERRESRKRQRQFAGGATVVAALLVTLGILLNNYVADLRVWEARDRISVAQTSVRGSGVNLVGGALAALEALNVQALSAEDSAVARESLRDILALLPASHESLPVLGGNSLSPAESDFLAAAFGGVEPLVVAYAGGGEFLYRDVAGAGTGGSWVGGQEITALAFSPDGDYVATAAWGVSDHGVHMHDVERSTSKDLFEPELPVLAMAFADRGSNELSLLIADDSGLGFIDPASDTPSIETVTSFVADSIAVANANGAERIVAAVRASGSVRIWTNGADHSRSLQCRPQSFSALGISGNSRLLAIASRNEAAGGSAADSRGTAGLGCRDILFEVSQSEADSDDLENGRPTINPEGFILEFEGGDNTGERAGPGQDDPGEIDAEVDLSAPEAGNQTAQTSYSENTEEREASYVGEWLDDCANANSTIQVFDIHSETLHEIGRVSAGECVIAVSLNQAGTSLSAITANGAVHEWTLQVPGHLAGVDFDSGLYELHMNPEGTRVAVQPYDGEFRFWDVARLEEISLPGAGDGVFLLGISTDGRTLWTSNYQGRIRSIDIESGEEIWTLQVEQDEQVVGTSSDGTSVLTVDSFGHIRLTTSSSDGPLLRLNGGDDLFTLAMSDDATRIAASFYDGTVKLWDAENGQVIGEREGPEVSDELFFSRDGSRLISGSGSGSGQVTMFDARTGEEIEQWTDSDGRPAVVFSQDSSVVLIARSDDEVGVYGSGDGSLRSKLSMGYQEVYETANGDGSLIVTTTVGVLRVWKTEDAEEAEPILDWSHEAPVYEVLISPSSRYVASAAYDGALQVWDVEDRAEALRISDSANIAGMIFVNGESALRVVFDDGTLRDIPIDVEVETCSRLGATFDADTWPTDEYAKRYGRVCPRR